MLIGGVAFTAIGRPWHFYVPLDKKGIFVLILIILIGTTMAFLCFLKGVSVIGPDKALLIGALEPVSATVMAAYRFYDRGYHRFCLHPRNGGYPHRFGK